MENTLDDLLFENILKLLQTIITYNSTSLLLNSEKFVRLLITHMEETFAIFEKADAALDGSCDASLPSSPLRSSAILSDTSPTQCMAWDAMSPSCNIASVEKIKLLLDIVYLLTTSEVKIHTYYVTDIIIE